MKIRILTFLFLLLLAGPGLMLAQEEIPEEKFLRGSVVDATTNTPLPGAFVHLKGEEWGVLTTSEGNFALPGVGPGTWFLEVEQLGYVDLTQLVLVEEPAEKILVAMAPDPILLEGIGVVTDRFESRRRGYPVSSRAFDRDELSMTAGGDVLDFIENRFLLRTVPCSNAGGQRLPSFGSCAWVRGRISPVAVFVDETRVLGGLDHLRAFQPHELHRIEVYSRGQHIRVYTEWFMEKAGRARLLPIPFIR